LYWVSDLPPSSSGGSQVSIRVDWSRNLRVRLRGADGARVQAAVRGSDCERWKPSLHRHSTDPPYSAWKRGLVQLRPTYVHETWEGIAPQGCQMFIFRTKIVIWVHFGESCSGIFWSILIDIWSMVRPFDIISYNLVYFHPFWYVVPRKIWQPWYDTYVPRMSSNCVI
jgi:hypothetical protein